MIYQFTGEKSIDDLATCISAQENLLYSFENAADTLMNRYNDDLVNGVSALNDIFKTLDTSVTGCKPDTMKNIKLVQERVTVVEGEILLANVADNKHHIELTYSMMKMQAQQHDFFRYGVNLAEFYLTATQN